MMQHCILGKDGMRKCYSQQLSKQNKVLASCVILASCVVCQCFVVVVVVVITCCKGCRRKSTKVN